MCDRKADLGIATQTDARTDLVSTPLHTDEFIAVMAPGHALAARRSLEWAQVARQPLIGYLPGNPVRNLIPNSTFSRWRASASRRSKSATGSRPSASSWA